MEVAVQPPRDRRIRLAATLARRSSRRRPNLAAARAGLLVALAVGAVMLVLRSGPGGAVGETLVFGLAAIVYVMADFAAELPLAGDGAEDPGSDPAGTVPTT